MGIKLSDINASQLSRIRSDAIVHRVDTSKSRINHLVPICGRDDAKSFVYKDSNIRVTCAKCLRIEGGPISFILPYPPSVNKMYCQSHGRRVLIREGRDYKSNAASIARAAGARPIVGDVCVNIDIYRKRKAGDLDNTLKILLDSLKGVAWKDDSQVKRIVAERFEDKENPRAEVIVYSA